jgi:hypothetical protein
MDQKKNVTKRINAHSMFYWVLTGFLAFESILSAFWDFNWLNKGYSIGLMQHLGFPHYFLVIKGICNLLAAPVFVFPGMRLLKEWTYFGTFLTYISAIASHLAVGDGFGAIVAPILFLSIAIASWALRPDSRRFKIV